MHTYGAKNSDCEIHILPIPNESQFNADQTFIILSLCRLTECSVRRCFLCIKELTSHGRLSLIFTVYTLNLRSSLLAYGLTVVTEETT